MAPEVRLTGPDNEPLGVVSIMEALRLAGEAAKPLAAAAATFLAKLLDGLQAVDLTTYLPALAAILAYTKFVK